MSSGFTMEGTTALEGQQVQDLSHAHPDDVGEWMLGMTHKISLLYYPVKDSVFKPKCPFTCHLHLERCCQVQECIGDR